MSALLATRPPESPLPRHIQMLRHQALLWADRSEPSLPGQESKTLRVRSARLNGPSCVDSGRFPVIPPDTQDDAACARGLRQPGQVSAQPHAPDTHESRRQLPARKPRVPDAGEAGQDRPSWHLSPTAEPEHGAGSTEGPRLCRPLGKGHESPKSLSVLFRQLQFAKLPVMRN